MSEKAMKLALEALEWEEAQTAYPSRMLTNAIKSIKEALAKQEQGEPVAHINQNGVIHEAGYPWGANNTLEPLYRHLPQQRKPLTQEQIDSIPLKNLNKYNTTVAKKYLVRTVEAMHNIKE
jgi:hypothetical protein